MRRILSRSRSAPAPPALGTTDTHSSSPTESPPPRYTGSNGTPLPPTAPNDEKPPALLAPLRSQPTQSLSKIDGCDSSMTHLRSLSDMQHGDRRLSTIGEGRASQPHEVSQSCCFAVVNKVPSYLDHGDARPISRVFIRDQSLISVCRDLFEEASGSAGSDAQLEVDLDSLLASFHDLERKLEELTRTSPDPRTDSTVKAVGALVTYLRREHGGTLAKIAELTSRGQIIYDTLFALFVPGAVVVAKCADTGEWCAYKLKSATRVCTSSADVYDLLCESIDVLDEPSHCACCSVHGSSSPIPISRASSDSSTRGVSGVTKLRRVRRHVLLPRFSGAVAINTLGVFPLKYHPDPSTLEASLVARGAKWLSLQGIRHVRYSGPAMYTLSLGQCKTTVRYEVSAVLPTRAMGYSCAL
ncbi:hypothetical protein C8Q77DRAFT_762547 [Trametes polyzona]|nr:hypothetical protein C8Q77DRAFT_762547 [Trametes polyzona]